MQLVMLDSFVVYFPGRDTVDHFPVLTALAGVLVQLLLKTDGTR